LGSLLIDKYQFFVVLNYLTLIFYDVISDKKIFFIKT